MNYFDKHRMTGRTTRMVEEAIRLSKEGRAVYILAACKSHAMCLQKWIDEDIPNSGIKCEPLTNEFNWDMLSVPGAHPNCAFLVDHYAIESKFPGLIGMLTQFNKETQ